MLLIALSPFSLSVIVQPEGIATFLDSVPVLLVHGTEDKTIPIGTVRLAASTGVLLPSHPISLSPPFK